MSSVEPSPHSIAELQAAGLYDPAAPGAAERLALIEWLARHGATVADMVRTKGSLLDLVPILASGPGPWLTLSELSERTGLSAERFQAVRFAAGLPPLDPDDAVLTEADTRTLSFFTMGEELVGKEVARRFTQVLGASLARIAEAAVAVALVNLEGPILQTGGGDVALAEARFRAVQTTAPLADAIAQFFRAHMSVAARRLRSSQAHGAIGTAQVTVGFVDLVGFTTLARRIEPRALVAIVERFEETAHDVTALHNGRVIKFVGDEVMFVTESAPAACEIALDLVGHFADDPSVAPRGGLAAGEVLVRGGDYYGPVVNLASRLSEVAVPREVLVTDAVRVEAAAGRFRFEPAGRRVLKGFDEPVRLFTAERPGTSV